MLKKTAKSVPVKQIVKHSQQAVKTLPGQVLKHTGNAGQAMQKQAATISGQAGKGFKEAAKVGKAIKKEVPVKEMRDVVKNVNKVRPSRKS